MAQTPPTPKTSQYGDVRGRSAMAREVEPGHWQVKMHDPTNRAAGHDGWVMLGGDYPTLADAATATGLTIR